MGCHPHLKEYMIHRERFPEKETAIYNMQRMSDVKHVYESRGGNNVVSLEISLLVDHNEVDDCGVPLSWVWIAGGRCRQDKSQQQSAESEYRGLYALSTSGAGQPRLIWNGQRAYHCLIDLLDSLECEEQGVENDVEKSILRDALSGLYHLVSTPAYVNALLERM